ncbi:hypothetical protein PanWU01x14_317640 [Parasponia andersonii]|uniref:Uncharacterized protein n=1 Tax=Parasponia andersonii TaxID=3476 RepID=A0A2P5AMJ8_PARAD|nr:hypothetical protein PanWU01x14_317640 [Parasponia andersonii]
MSHLASKMWAPPRKVPARSKKLEAHRK